MKIKAVYELVRLDHGFMFMIAVFIGALVTGQDVIDNLISIGFASLTALFLQAGAFSLNDYMDLDIDRINNRMDRPLVRGELKPETALLIFFITFPLGIIFSFLVNEICFLIALVTGFLAILYDVRIKKLKYLGNLYVAYTTSIPFIFGSFAVSSKVCLPAMILALIAFLSNLGREIMKDLLDIQGDRARGVRSLPLLLGEKSARLAVAILYLSAVSLSPLPFFVRGTVYCMDYLYLCTIILADLIFLHISLGLTKRTSGLQRYRKLSLIGMMVGLSAFLLGAIA